MPLITVPKLRQVFPVRKSSSHWLDYYASYCKSACKPCSCFRAIGNHPPTRTGMVQPGDRTFDLLNGLDHLDSLSRSSLNNAYDSPGTNSPGINSPGINSPGINSLDVHSLIQAARQKLRDPHTSDQLKLTAYIKFCCLAIQKSFIAEQMVPPANLHDHYLQKLTQCETTWWNQCHIIDGKVISEHPDVQDLLNLLDRVVRIFEED